MKKNKALIGIGIAAMVLMIASAGITFAQEAKTIVGILNEDNDLIDQNGTIYVIDGDGISEEDSLNVGAVFEVNGIMDEDDEGTKWITIQSYKILESE